MVASFAIGWATPGLSAPDAVQPTIITIQVSAFKELREAQAEVARLKAQGQEAMFQYEAVGNHGMWYRVYVGRFETMEQARAHAQELKKRGIITWSWVKTLTPAAPAQPEVKSVPAGPIPAKNQTPGAPRSTAGAALPAAAGLSAPPSAPAITPKVLAPAPQTSAATIKEAPAQAPARPSEATAVEEKEKPAASGTFNLKSQTTFRDFQRDTPKGDNLAVMPLYQFLQMDYGNTEQGGWSAHAYGWGRYDMADSAYYEKSADGELLYGYLEYSKPYSELRLNLGRQHIFAGVTNQSVDGLRLATGLGKSVTAMAFGGVTATSSESSSDLTYGARLALHPQLFYELGLSFQQTDVEGDPDEKAGVDFHFNWSEWLTVQGLSSYNIDTQDWREHSYGAALRYKAAVLEPGFQMFNYKDYFGTGNERNNLFHFLKDSQEQITIWGADLEWMGAAPVRIGARGKQYAYAVRHDSANYFGGLLSFDFRGGSQVGAEVGRMTGQSADNTYMLYRAYFYWSNPLRLSRSFYFSGDGIWQNYDVPVYGKDSAKNYSMSMGKRFWEDRLELKLTGLYSQDPYLKDDVQGICSVIYQY